MIESFINHQKVDNHVKLMLLGAGYVLVAALFADIVFKPFASVATFFLATIACVPFMNALITGEEMQLAKFRSEMSFLREYSHVTVGLLSLFIGMVLGFLALFFIVQAWFPQEMGSLFSFQQMTLSAIVGQTTGQAAAQTAGHAIGPATGHAVTAVTVPQLLWSNGVVFLLCLALAFCYTFGSLTVLAWNASVVGYALAQWTINNAAQVTTAGALGLGFLRYFLHGIPEFAAYVVVGLAGGIMSVAFANHDLWTPKWKLVMKDALQLVVIAAALLVVGALIEVTLTPLLYGG